MFSVQAYAQKLIFGGASGLVLATYFFASNHLENQDRAAALAKPAPARVEIADFDPTRHSNEIGEAVLTGAIDLRSAYVLKGEGKALDFWAAPLRASIGDGTDKELKAVLLNAFSPVSAETLAEWTESMSSLGPVIRFHGVDAAPKRAVVDAATRAFAKEGLTVTQDTLFLKPLRGDRAKALAPSTSAMPAILAAFGLGSLALGLVLRRLNQRRRPA